MSETSDFDALRARTSIGDDRLIDLLFGLGVGQHLVGLLYALETIELIHRHARLHQPYSQMMEFSLVTQLANELRSTKCPVHWGQRPQTSGPRPDLFKGQVGDYPVYAFLLTPATRQLVTSARGAELCGVFLSYANEFFHEFADRSAFAKKLTGREAQNVLQDSEASVLRQAGQTLRYASAEKLDTEWMPTPKVEPITYARVVADVRRQFVQRSDEPSEGEHKERNQLSFRLAHLVLVASGARHIRDRSGSTPSGELEERDSVIRGGLVSSRTTIDDGGVLTTLRLAAFAKSDEADDDLAPDERATVSEIQIDLVEESKDTDDFSQVAAHGYQQEITGETRSKQLARYQHAPQSLPGYLTAAEIEALDKFLGKPLTKLSPDAQWLAIAMRATGRSPEACGKAVFSASGKAPSGVIEFLTDKMAWRLPVPAPAYANQTLWDDGQCRPCIDTITLADHFGASRLLPNVHSFESEPERILIGRRSTAMTELRKAMKRFRPQLRLRPEKLPKATRQALLEACPDHAIPALITGCRQHNSATAVHYSTPRLVDAEHFYLRAMTGHAAPTLSGLNDSSLHIGSRLCPTDEYVQWWIQQAQSLIRKLRRTDMVSCHRVYVRYVALLCGHAATLRAVCDPHPQLIDPQTGLLVTDDKSKVPGMSTRVVGMLKIIEKILKKYELHRATVLDALDRTDAPHSTRPYFFEIEADGSIVPLRPKHFRTPVAGLTFDVPPNALRRHMRTRLMEAGLDAQLIDAWMGHWLDALSPHDELSTFHHVKAMSDVKRVVDQVIPEMGWRAVSGWNESS